MAKARNPSQIKPLRPLLPHPSCLWASWWGSPGLRPAGGDFPALMCDVGISLERKCRRKYGTGANVEQNGA